MKKTTKLQAAAEREEVKPRQHGPQKEKIQITLRIDQELMNEVYAQMKADNTRITDLTERGYQLALAEARHEMPAWTKQVRFVLANATREQQVLIRGLAIAMVEEQVLQIMGKPLTPEEKKLFEVCQWFLQYRNKLVHAPACLEYYSRYGKSAEEIAKLGSL